MSVQVQYRYSFIFPWLDKSTDEESMDTEGLLFTPEGKSRKCISEEKTWSLPHLFDY